ncbi:MAG TPA: MBL fold metallo-hydrolase [Telmatospirillum sp.]|nr:MBL fold metallo-hydrolase [Telmatospirillum sp.]
MSKNDMSGPTFDACCSRRGFLTGAVAGAAGLATFNPATLLARESIMRMPEPTVVASGKKVDIGVCRSIKVTCISEVGWHNNDRLNADVKSAGGWDTNQWDVPWSAENAGGSCSLVEVEGLDGKHTRLLIDVGWNQDYMKRRFAETGVDKMLVDGTIDALFLTHEHVDHLFALQAVLDIRRDIPIYIPATFRPEAYRFMAGTDFPVAGARNAVTHTGELIRLKAGGVNPITPGLAAVTFDLPIILQTEGEQSLYANVKDKGLVVITGCGHQGLPRIMEVAASTLTAADKVHGLYGGLHMAPFGPLAPAQEAIIRDMPKFGFERIACNHCTGLPAVELMTKLGFPIVRGTATQGSTSDLYVGNGDSVTFG